LGYCNHCGAKLSGAEGDGVSKTSEVKTEKLLFFMTSVFLFGLGIIIFLMMAMKLVFGPENIGPIIAFTLLSFLIMLGLEGVFVSMLLGRKKTDKEAAKELSEAKPRVLPEPAFSVTEHTTRSLETVGNEHKTE
jgi:flagellar basal body-associated protein FliL